MTSQKELIPMRPGDILRHEREARKITLERAASQSRIKPTILEAIESGSTGDIPSVYLRGYIRNYARYLGIDPADVEDHVEELKGAEPEVRSVFTINTRNNRAEKWLKVSSYLVASALIATLAWQFTHEAVKWSQGDSPLNTTAQSEPSASPLELEGENQPASRHLSASIASVEVMKQRGELGGSSAAEDAWAAIGQPQEQVALEPGQHLLRVTTSADTWVEIFTADDEQLEMDLIRADSEREYIGDGPFRIMVGRASAVILQLDGELVDLGPHTRGNVARLTLGAPLTAGNDAIAERPEQ